MIQININLRDYDFFSLVLDQPSAPGPSKNTSIRTDPINSGMHNVCENVRCYKGYIDLSQF